MPIYVYKCTKCNRSKEILVKVAPDKVKCDHCSSDCQRDFSGEKPNFHLKGGCWARNGYEMSDTECLAENERMLREDEVSK